MFEFSLTKAVVKHNLHYKTLHHSFCCPLLLATGTNWLRHNLPRVFSNFAFLEIFTKQQKGYSRLLRVTFCRYFVNTRLR